MKKYDIKCPKCTSDQSVEICQTIDGDLQPELRDSLLENRLNVCKCEQCGYQYRIDAPIFYRDPELGQAILCIPGEIDGTEDGIAKLEDYVLQLQSQLPAERESEPIQLVRAHASLVERIFVIEAHMDPRIVEYVKYLIHTRNPQKADPRRKRLLFNAKESTPEQLVFIIQDLESHALEGVLEYERSAYEAFTELFDQDELTPDLLELFPGPFIDARACLLAENESGV